MVDSRYYLGLSPAVVCSIYPTEALSDQTGDSDGSKTCRFWSRDPNREIVQRFPKNAFGIPVKTGAAHQPHV